MTPYPLSATSSIVYDDNGLPMAGGTITTYVAGTTTLLQAYQDADGIVAHDNPIVLNTDGGVPGTGLIFMLDDIAYKMVIKNRLGAVSGTFDDILANKQMGPPTVDPVPPSSIVIIDNQIFQPGTVSQRVTYTSVTTPDGVTPIITLPPGGGNVFYIGNHNAGPGLNGNFLVANITVGVQAVDPAEAGKYSVFMDSTDVNAPVMSRGVVGGIAPEQYPMYLVYGTTLFITLVRTGTDAVGGVKVTLNGVAMV